MIAGTGIFFLLLTWIAIIDIAMRDFTSKPVQIGWGIAVALIPGIGCIAYFIFGIRQGKRRQKLQSPENSV
ncbi:Phospholipase_D-nuclease N-terminal domain-containing protein [Desulfonema limicola]|uniref:Phospholipase_D-nuclease N-terminal domain-containing protein n=2 Tax=Desulfonema limicola TaxID=45656 RepID=A0A975GHR7_9BACT|nr:Phospholipase_D-nuclease N-terminal domain-containing protein [Desulfonema limicola]